MAHYIQGTGGACVGCASDDACGGQTSGFVDDDADFQLTLTIRLRDQLEAQQLIIVVFEDTTGAGRKMRAIRSTSGGYIVGDAFTLTAAATYAHGIRTSHAGNQFILNNVGPSQVTIYEVDETTLAITAKSAPINLPRIFLDAACFIENDQVCFGWAVSNWPTTNATFFYRTGTITGGGTGITFNTEISELKTITTAVTGELFLKRVATDRVMAMITYLNVNQQFDARGLDDSAGLSLGPSIAVANRAGIFNYHVFRADEAGDGMLVMVQEAALTKDLYYFRYGVTGTPVTSKIISVMELNSPTIGNAAISSGGLKFTPVLINGSNDVSLGTPGDLVPFIGTNTNVSFEAIDNASGLWFGQKDDGTYPPPTDPVEAFIIT